MFISAMERSRVLTVLWARAVLIAIICGSTCSAFAQARPAHGASGRHRRYHRRRASGARHTRRIHHNHRGPIPRMASCATVGNESNDRVTGNRRPPGKVGVASLRNEVSPTSLGPQELCGKPRASLFASAASIIGKSEMNTDIRVAEEKSGVRVPLYPRASTASLGAGWWSGVPCFENHAAADTAWHHDVC
jgi:hypothetical protein